MRLSKDVNGDKTTHIWDGSNIVLDFGATNDRYVRGINLIKSDTNGLYLYNAHGDVVQLINISEDVTKVYQYDAFGVEKDKDSSDTNPFRYCGEYYDKETGTIYLRARHYNPSTGRFISQESVAGKASDPLSLNLYTYGHSNPVRFIDPSGHIKMDASQHDQNPRYAAIFAAKGNKTTFDDLRIWDGKIASVFGRGSASKNSNVFGGSSSRGGGGGRNNQYISFNDDEPFALESLLTIENIMLAVDIFITVSALINGDVVGTVKDVTNLFRAVSPDEFYDIMSDSKFRVTPKTMEAKQFGLTLEETLKFADRFSDIAAIVEVEVPTDLLYNIADLTHVDTLDFKSGTITIGFDKLEEFNNLITKVKHTM